ncbi:hypothetical protein [Phenylobacterium sp.]|uniref:hypothetical protein n=1 Tax=Phenylobacterium sp. TaxID=1871053 RepID=UPI003D2A9957
MSQTVEVRWLWRRIYACAATLLNSAGVAAIIWRLSDPDALKWLGLSLVGANVVMATLYLAGATVTDWAKLAAAARGPRD